jgi:hypothetical protein
MSVKPEAALMVAFPAPRQAPGSWAEWEVFDLHGGGEEAAGGRSPYFATAAFLPDPSSGRMSSPGGPPPASRPGGNGEPTPTLQGERMESLVALFKRAQVFAASRTVAQDPTLPSR